MFDCTPEITPECPVKCIGKGSTVRPSNVTGVTSKATTPVTFQSLRKKLYKNNFNKKQKKSKIKNLKRHVQIRVFMEQENEIKVIIVSVNARKT